MADHEDYETGSAPAAHGPSHELDGDDEISIAGLRGVLADNQFCIPHDLGGAKHIADTLADLNTKVSDADLEDKAVLENTMDAKIGFHAAMPTVHQDAEALILTHKGDASAHHAKYTDAEARALMSPISIPAAAFQPKYDTYDWYIDDWVMYNRTALTSQEYFAPVFFPEGVTVTGLLLYGYRDDALSSMHLYLRRITNVGGHSTMAFVAADWVTGWSSGVDSTISNPVINNSAYAYALELALDPNDNVGDVKFARSKITFTG